MRLTISGFSKAVLTYALRDLRNSITHGIEVPQERTQVNKPTVGRIDIHLVQVVDGSFELNYSDDGTGINYDAIR